LFRWDCCLIAVLTFCLCSCSGADITVPRSARRIATYESEAQVATLFQEHKQVLVLIENGIYLFPCARNRTIGGEIEGRKISGATEGRMPSGELDNRASGGAVESRTLGGGVQGRKLGGGEEARKAGGSEEGRTLGGIDESRRLGVANEERAGGGAGERRMKGGASEARDFGGENQKSRFTCCREKNDSGFHIQGVPRGVLVRYFDGFMLREVVDFRVED